MSCACSFQHSHACKSALFNDKHGYDAGRCLHSQTQQAGVAKDVNGGLPPGPVSVMSTALGTRTNALQHWGAGDREGSFGSQDETGKISESEALRPLSSSIQDDSRGANRRVPNLYFSSRSPHANSPRSPPPGWGGWGMNGIGGNGGIV